MKYCIENLGVDVSGNTTYTGLPFPMPTTNFTWPADSHGDEGLKLSDKIALGIGIGFGVPTILVTLGAWLCVRHRKDRPGAKSESKAGPGKLDIDVRSSRSVVETRIWF